MRPMAFLVAALMLAACNPAVAPATTPSSPSSDADAESSVAASARGSAAPIVGEWVRTATCDEALAAFHAAGLDDQIPAWVVGNFVGEGASAAPGSECANAKPPVPHTHVFTADGRFGSRDEHGQDVDSGDYRVVDADTLSFTSHGEEFGYAGDILVDYTIDGTGVTFVVQVPASCDAACRLAYGWALSAFFGPRPFERS